MLTGDFPNSAAICTGDFGLHPKFMQRIIFIRAVGSVILFAVGRRPQHEANNSPHVIPKLRVRGIVPLLPHTYAICGTYVSARNNFTFFCG